MSGVVKVIPLTGKPFLFLIQASSHFSTSGFFKGFLSAPGPMLPVQTPLLSS